MHGPPDPLGLSDLRRRLPRREQVPRPTRRQVAVVLVVALVVATGWVRLADPVALRGQPPVVDPAEPPAAVVGDAVERLRYVDYTYRLSPGGATDQVTKVENSDRQAYTVQGGIRKRYLTEDGLWLKFRGEGWRTVQETAYGEAAVNPFDPDAIRAADVTVLEDGDVLVVAIDDPATVSAVLRRDVPGDRLQFFVDLESGRLVKVRLHRVVGGDGGWWTYTFYDYRSTTVERPPGVPPRSPGDLLRDLLSG